MDRSDYIEIITELLRVPYPAGQDSILHIITKVEFCTVIHPEGLPPLVRFAVFAFLSLFLFIALAMIQAVSII